MNTRRPTDSCTTTTSSAREWRSQRTGRALPAAFGHSAKVRRFWRRLAGDLLASGAETPFYLFSAVPVQSALRELDRHFGHLPIRHWLSCKTQPLPPLVRWWRRRERPIEVVSEFELLGALAEAFEPNAILANGPAKHSWLPNHPVPGLCVNFDSVNETMALAPLARKLGWTVGLRLTMAQEVDTEWRDCPAQFGMTPPEMASALAGLRRLGVKPKTIHFHLRTNVPEPALYEQAIQEASRVCHDLGFAPEHLDCGGGFPAPHVLSKKGQRLDARFELGKMAGIYKRALRLFPGLREIWLENGRWLSAGSGALVVRVLEVKERGGVRHLLCDGGRTLHALVSIWENHEILCCQRRLGRLIPTIVAGPTCMAFDRLGGCGLPETIGRGDCLVWLDAGAYHLPWETRFSHGLAAIWWHDGLRTERIRGRGSAREWWAEATPCLT